jgi:RimJ/RimL family protein N-acetyltransferase
MTQTLSISLDPYTLDDAQPVFEAVNESRAELSRWMPWCHPTYSLQDSRSWVQSQVKAFAEGAEYSFVVRDPSGFVVGACGLNHLDRLNRTANLGYWVRSSQTRRGIASAAARQLASWAFTHTDLLRLEVLASTENTASQRVALKAGAVREGILRSRLLLSGRSHDGTVYSFVRGDFLADKSIDNLGM